AIMQVATGAAHRREAGQAGPKAQARGRDVKPPWPRMPSRLSIGSPSMTHPTHSTESAEARANEPANDDARRAELMRAELMDAKNTRSFQLLAKRAQKAHEIRCRCDAAYAANWQVVRSILREVAKTTKRQNRRPPS